MITDSLLEKNLIPDPIIRFGIRRLLAQRLREIGGEGEARQQELIETLKRSPIAMHTDAANQQHYEVPTAFYQAVLGKHMKYSCGYWQVGVVDLDRSEEDMLRLTCERAQLVDGQTVLELGCGWGSLSLWVAAHYPKSRFTVVSNSRTQREYIETQGRERGLNNLTVITSDMNDFTIDQEFDRVVSVEMFEHMRNYERLLEKVAGFLKPEGKLFVHLFTHRQFSYLFEVKDRSDWMSQYFFTGGIMPSDDLLFHFTRHFETENHWRVDGTHYQKTSEAWLRRMDEYKDRLLPILAETYGSDQVTRWWVYWRVFFMSCAELWGYHNGNEWQVSHYLFRKKVVTP